MRISVLHEAREVGVISRLGDTVQYWVNPSYREAVAVLNKSDYGEARIYISDDGDVLMWPAESATHYDIAQMIGEETTDEGILVAKDKKRGRGERILIHIPKWFKERPRKLFGLPLLPISEGMWNYTV